LYCQLNFKGAVLSKITEKTIVQFTFLQILSAIGILLIGAGTIIWALLNATTGSITENVRGLRDDLNLHRQTLHLMQAANQDAALRVRDAELRLTNEIGQFRLGIERSAAQSISLESKISQIDSKLVNYENTIIKYASSHESLIRSMDTLNVKITEMERIAAARQIRINDPAFLNNFRNTLSGAGLDAGKVIVIPFDPTAVPQR
jgi:hypothetical protein